MRRQQIFGAALAVAFIGLGPRIEAQPPPGGAQADHVAALKQSIGEGTKKLAQYEWIETTSISLKGEEKSRKVNRCYYGADGKVLKVSLDQPAAKPEEKGGRPGKRGGGKIKEQIVENKKDDITEYMQRAAALIHSYVPPSAARIQAVKDGGRLAANPQAGGKVRLELKQYLQAGDLLTIDLDPATNRLLGVGVNSYLDKPEDVVTLAVQMNTLADGAFYAAQTTLDAKAKNITVVITNSGHKPMAR